MLIEIDDLKIQDIEETLIRLHVDGRRLENQFKNFVEGRSLIEGTKKSSLNKKQREELSEILYYRFYQGKMLAYQFFLANILERRIVPEAVAFLRGMIIEDDGKMIQTKGPCL